MTKTLSMKKRKKNQWTNRQMIDRLTTVNPHQPDQFMFSLFSIKNEMPSILLYTCIYEISIGIIIYTKFY